MKGKVNLLKHIMESIHLISPQTPKESPRTVLHFISDPLVKYLGFSSIKYEKTLSIHWEWNGGLLDFHCNNINTHITILTKLSIKKRPVQLPELLTVRLLQGLSQKLQSLSLVVFSSHKYMKKSQSQNLRIAPGPGNSTTHDKGWLPLDGNGNILSLFHWTS